MKMKELGEFGFIEEIRKLSRSRLGVTVGIGDDAAILRARAGYETIFTTDMLIEQIHFRAGDEASAYEIGRKAMAVNVSDIAAMGGVPTYAVVALGVPDDTDADFMRGLFKGLRSAADESGAAIVGGDTNRSSKLVLSVALLGEVKTGKAIRRSGAQPGDVIFVTGELGGSYASRKHLNFKPRLKESRFLAEGFKIHSMMDLSDGLASDLWKIAKESRVGAVIAAGALPVSAWAKSMNAAMTDGEDFELLWTLSPKEAARLTLAPKPKGLANFSPVGRITARKEGVRLIHSDGHVQAIEEKGYDHFR